MPYATQSQKNYIKQLLEDLDADLADFTGQELHELTSEDASAIIAELKTEKFTRRGHR